MSPRHPKLDTRHDIPKAVSPRSQSGSISGFVSSWLPKMIGAVGELPLGLSWLHPRAPPLSPHIRLPFQTSSKPPANPNRTMRKRNAVTQGVCIAADGMLLANVSLPSAGPVGAGEITNVLVAILVPASYCV